MSEYAESQPYDEYSDEPRGNNRTWLIVGVVIIAVLVCCCCLAVVAALAVFGEDIAQELDSLSGLMPVLERVAALA